MKSSGFSDVRHSIIDTISITTTYYIWNDPNISSYRSWLLNPSVRECRSSESSLAVEGEARRDRESVIKPKL